jgi:hypothetical protein
VFVGVFVWKDAKDKVNSKVIALCILVGVSGPAFSQISVGLNVPAYPQLVVVPGYPVYYAPRVDGNLFFYDGMY